MAVIKRCEKEVPGSMTQKQEQGRRWLAHFIPHYCHRCTGGDGCPATHSTQHSKGGEIKRYMSETDEMDKGKIAQLQALITKMQADVHRFIHGYNTCSVERTHSERTVLTNKRVEYWKNWLGRCKVVELLHNFGRHRTGELLYQELGWTVTNEVWKEVAKIDRDKTKHRQIKSAPTYNSRKKTLEYECGARKKVVKDRVADEKKMHTYSVKKQLLYNAIDSETRGRLTPRQAGEDESATPASAVVRRGRPRKRRKEWKDTTEEDKENIAPLVNVNVIQSASTLMKSEKSGRRKKVVKEVRVGEQSRPPSTKIVIVIDSKDLLWMYSVL